MPLLVSSRLVYLAAHVPSSNAFLMHRYEVYDGICVSAAHVCGRRQGRAAPCLLLCGVPAVNEVLCARAKLGLSAGEEQTHVGNVLRLTKVPNGCALISCWFSNCEMSGVLMKLPVEVMPHIASSQTRAWETQARQEVGTYAG